MNKKLIERIKPYYKKELVRCAQDDPWLHEVIINTLQNNTSTDQISNADVILLLDALIHCNFNFEFNNIEDLFEN